MLKILVFLVSLGSLGPSFAESTLVPNDANNEHLKNIVSVEISPSPIGKFHLYFKTKDTSYMLVDYYGDQTQYGFSDAQALKKSLLSKKSKIICNIDKPRFSNSHHSQCQLSAKSTLETE